MFPNELKRVHIFTGSLAVHEVRPGAGVYSADGAKYVARDVKYYFEPTGTYIPDDWAESDSSPVPTTAPLGPGR